MFPKKVNQPPEGGVETSPAPQTTRQNQPEQSAQPTLDTIVAIQKALRIMPMNNSDSTIR